MVDNLSYGLDNRPDVNNQDNSKDLFDTAFESLQLAQSNQKDDELFNQAFEGVQAVEPSKGLMEQVAETVGDKAKRAGLAVATGATFDLAGGAWGLAEEAAALGSKFIGQPADVVLHGLGAPPDRSIDLFAPIQELSSYVRKGNVDVSENVSEIINKDAGRIERGIYSGIRSVGLNAPGMAASVITGNPSIALTQMGLVTGGESAGQALDAGLDPVRALKLGVGTGGTEVLTEMMPIARLLGDLNVGSSLLKTIGYQAIIEIPSEQVATIVQNFFEWGYLHPEKTLKKYLAEIPSNAADTLISTLASVGIQTGALHTADKLLRAPPPEDKVPPPSDTGTAQPETQEPSPTNPPPVGPSRDDLAASLEDSEVKLPETAPAQPDTVLEKPDISPGDVVEHVDADGKILSGTVESVREIAGDRVIHIFDENNQPQTIFESEGQVGVLSKAPVVEQQIVQPPDPVAEPVDAMPDGRPIPPQFGEPAVQEPDLFVQPVQEEKPISFKDQIPSMSDEELMAHYTGKHIKRKKLAGQELEGRYPDWAVTKSIDVAEAEAQVDTAPTEGQKEAGNYRKGSVSINGLPISIENPKGSVRSGKDADGQTWEVVMPNSYGYVKGTEGADGDHVDVFIGEDHNAQEVYVVDQIDTKTGKFDEHKVLMSFPDKASAVDSYIGSFSDNLGESRIGGMTTMTVAEFKDWIKKGKTKKPLAFKEEAVQDADASRHPVKRDKEAGDGQNLAPQGGTEQTESTKKPSEPAIKEPETEWYNIPFEDLGQQAGYRAADQKPTGVEPEALGRKPEKVSQPDQAPEPTTFAGDIPDVLYHSTAQKEEFSEFDISKSGSATDQGNVGRAVYLSPFKSIATGTTKVQGRILEAKVTVQKSIEIVRDENYKESIQAVANQIGVEAAPEWSGTKQVNKEFSRQFSEKAQSAGFDSVVTVAPNENRDIVEIAVYDSKNVTIISQQESTTERQALSSDKPISPKGEKGQTADFTDKQIENAIRKAKPWIYLEDLKKDVAKQLGVGPEYDFGTRVYSINRALGPKLIKEKGWTEATPEILSKYEGHTVEVLRGVGGISGERVETARIKSNGQGGFLALPPGARTKGYFPEYIREIKVATQKPSKPAVAENGPIEQLQEKLGVPDYRLDLKRLPKGVALKFYELGDLQRALPEIKMLETAKAVGSGVMSNAVEHIGDLSNRISAHQFISHGIGMVAEKVAKMHRSLNSKYGFEREFLENLENNAEYKKTDVEDFKKKAFIELQKYADEHKKLPVYNRAQWLSREAAIALGEQRYLDVRPHLAELKKHTVDVNVDDYISYVTQHELGKDGFPTLYVAPEDRRKKSPKPAQSEKGATVSKRETVQTTEKQEPVHEDFGEKIEGAKKDLWRDYRKAISDALPDDLKDIKLSKHFPEPNYEALIENGVEINVLATIKAMRDTIPNKPRQPHKLRSWAGTVSALRDFSSDLLDGKMSVEKVTSKLDVSSYALRGLSRQIELYTELGYPAFTKAKGWVLRQSRISRVGDTQELKATGLKWVASYKSGFGNTFDTREEALNFLREKLENEPSKKKTTKLDIYRINRTREIIIGKKVASRKFIDLKKGFKSWDEARSYLKENEQELLDLLKKKKEIPAERRSVNELRRGKDYRKGEDVTAEKFASEFGFRGVQFGNYVEQKKRVMDVNNAYDAMLDMVDILDIPARAVSLDGTLGLAFGARGKGGASPAKAHYEPGQVVINLTKKSGSGSLGHEWFHAFDNNFGKRRKGSEFLTQSQFYTTEIRKEVVDAFSGVMNAIKQTELKKRSKGLDVTRTKDYWSTSIEMSARSFEAYLIHKAEQKNEANDYLANIVGEQAWSALTGDEEGSSTYPYPTDKEMSEHIAPAFDKLFEILKSKETDQGVALYSMGDKRKTNPAQARKADELEAKLTAILKKSGFSRADLKFFTDPKRTGLKNIDERVEGAYDKGVIYLSLYAKDPLSVLDHELIHALRAAGAFEKPEWALLESKAKKWRKKYNIDERYADLNLTESQLNEESIARAFQDHTVQGPVRRIINRLLKFLKNIKATLAGANLLTAEDVFDAVGIGYIKKGRRAPADIPAAYSLNSVEDRLVSTLVKAAKGLKQAKGRTVEVNTFSKTGLEPDQTEVWTLPVTESMRTAADVGLPLFSLSKNKKEALAEAEAGLDAALAEKLNKELRPSLGVLAAKALHPRQVAVLYKSFTPIYRKTLDMRKMRDTIVHDMTTFISPYNHTRKESKKRINAVMEVGRLNGKNYKAGKDGTITVKNEGLPNALHSKEGETITLDKLETEAYIGVRKAMNLGLDTYIQVVLEEYGFKGKGINNRLDLEKALRAEKDETKAERMVEALKLIKGIESSKRRGYVPFKRWGEIGITVRSKTEKSETASYAEEGEGGKKKQYKLVHYQRIELPKIGRKNIIGENKAVKDAITELRKQFPDDKYTIDPFEVKDFTDVRANLDLMDMDVLAASSDMSQEDYATLKEMISDAFMRRGFRAHFFKSENVPGYDGDFERSINDYAVSIAGHLAHRTYIPKLEKQLEKILKTGEVSLYNYSKKYIKSISDPVEEFATIRQLAFISYLMGNIASGVTNATQPFMVTGPWFYAQFGHARTAKEMTRAYKDAFAMIDPKGGPDGFFDFNKAPADVREGLLKAEADGSLIAQNTIEASATARTSVHAMRGFGRKLRKTVDVFSMTFSVPERLNRIVTYSAAYRFAIDPANRKTIMSFIARDQIGRADIANKTGADFAHAYGDYAVDNTQFVMGKINRPEIGRGVGVLPTQFLSFTFQSFELMYRLKNVHGEKSGKALGIMLLTVVAMAGVKGFPFADDLEEMFESAYRTLTRTDIDVDREMMKILSKAVGPTMAEAITKGLPATFLNIDMSFRLGYGNITPDSLVDLLGVSFDMLFVRPGQALMDLGRGDFLQATADLAPAIIRNPLQAYIWDQGGLKSKRTGDTIIIKENLTPFDKGMKALGFNTRKTTRIKERIYARGRAERAVSQLRGDYYDRLARALSAIARLSKDDKDAARKYQDEVRAIFSEIALYNDRVPVERRIDIRRRTLKQRLREEMLGEEAAKPSKRMGAWVTETEKMYGK